MCPVDMNNIATWPREVTKFLTTHSEELRIERKADQDYCLSSSEFRIMKNPPQMSRWREAEILIKNMMADRELIAFHATRLIDFDGVRKSGLLTLDLTQHVVRIKKALQNVAAADELAEIDAAVTKVLEADDNFIKRECAVWATPHRASLHDGGCDVFFDSYGG